MSLHTVTAARVKWEARGNVWATLWSATCENLVASKGTGQLNVPWNILRIYYRRPHPARYPVCKLLLRTAFRKYFCNRTAFTASCWFGNFEPHLFYVFHFSPEHTHKQNSLCSPNPFCSVAVYLRFTHTGTGKGDKITLRGLSRLSIPQMGPFDLERKRIIWFLTESVLLWSDIPA